MKKIYANKNDNCASVVHKVISSGEDELILYLPKGAALADDPKNFKLLKREVLAVGKKIIIESVDGKILEIASTCGFKIADGIFNRSKIPLMDIMPAKSRLESISRSPAAETADNDDSCEKEEEKGAEGRPGSSLLKRIGKFASVSAIIIGTGYVLFFVLPSADISIERKRTKWSFNERVSASASSPLVSKENATIPAQVFTISKNGVYSFPASGSEIVEKKSSGRITIYNAYSSEAQPLVKNTRFVTPEGKIFRITSAVTVPGAKISEGKIIPSSIEAEVQADGPGEGYNTGAVAKLRIPGFQDTPKYDGFYGELKEGTSGGFVGELKVPTEDDIKTAKEDVAKKVRTFIDSDIILAIPQGFKAIDGSISVSTVKEGVVSDANEKGEFSYGVMMEAKIVAFKEDDLISLLGAKFSSDIPEPHELKSKELSYSNPVVNFSEGKISFKVDFNGEWVRTFDSTSFKTEILGVSESVLKSAVFSIPGVQNAKADLWPFWVRSVPNNPSKISIRVD